MGFVYILGANLVTAITIQAIKDRIRLPDSIVVAYPPYRLQFLPSPSRILCLMDPLLPVGVLKSCIQAYTGGFKEFENTNRNSFTYDADAYNAFDLDLGHDDRKKGFLSRKQMQHSYSESQLNVIRAKYECQSNAFFSADEDDSFCSEFPYSDTERESACEDSIDSVENDNLNLKTTEKGATEESSVDSSSLLQSLSTQVSSKVQDLTTSISGYFSYALENNQKTKDDDQFDLVSSSDVRVSDLSNSPTYRKRSLDTQVIPDKINKSNNQPLKFTICKTCLYRSEQCICDVSPKTIRRRANKYKFSHHRMSHPQMARSNSLTLKDNKEGDLSTFERQRSITHCDTTHQDGILNTEEPLCSPTSKNKALQYFRLSLLGNSGSPPQSPTEKSKLQSAASPTLSPRVVYDRSTESCVILTPEEEKVDMKEEDVDDDMNNTKQQLGAGSKAFQDAKDPLMSPFLADDELLKQLPPITIVVSFLLETLSLFC